MFYILTMKSDFLLAFWKHWSNSEAKVFPNSGDWIGKLLIKNWPLSVLSYIHPDREWVVYQQLPEKVIRTKRLWFNSRGGKCEGFSISLAGGSLSSGWLCVLMLTLRLFTVCNIKGLLSVVCVQVLVCLVTQSQKMESKQSNPMKERGVDEWIMLLWTEV